MAKHLAEKEEKLFFPTNPHNLSVSDFSCYYSPKETSDLEVLVQQLVEVQHNLWGTL